MMKTSMAGWLLLAVCASPACSSQQQPLSPTPTDVCTTSTRSAESARLAPARPLGPSQAITLAVGESLCLEAKPGARWIEFERMTRVGKSSDLSLHMQSDDGSTTLSLHNPFDRPLVFDALVVLENGDRFPSSTCPVRPHEAHTERWQEPVTRVVLSDFSVVASSAPSADCE